MMVPLLCGLRVCVWQNSPGISFVVGHSDTAGVEDSRPFRNQHLQPVAFKFMLTLRDASQVPTIRCGRKLLHVMLKMKTKHPACVCVRRDFGLGWLCVTI